MSFGLAVRGWLRRVLDLGSIDGCKREWETEKVL